MGIKIGDTHVNVTSRAPEELAAPGIVRVFPSIVELDAASALFGGPATRPAWPGDPVVHPVPTRPGCFYFDSCLEWDPAAAGLAAEAREHQILLALGRIVAAAIAEAMRWRCDGIVLPLAAVAPTATLDAVRVDAFCEALIAATQRAQHVVRAVWVTT